jgi:plastocyanin
VDGVGDFYGIVLHSPTLSAPLRQERAAGAAGVSWGAPLARVVGNARLALAGTLRTLAARQAAARLRALGRLAAAALLAVLPLNAAGVGPALSGVGGTAQAAETWEVQAGGVDEQGQLLAQAYFPDPLTIRAGDTVHWRFAGGHSVTFNSGKPELPLLLPGPNPGERAVGPGIAPAGPRRPNATYDGTAQASSGLPMGVPPDQFSYRLTFTKPGRYAYVCTLHPGMRGEIDVAEANAPLPETPAQARARGQATLGVLLAKMRQDRELVRPAHAGGVHTAIAGLGNALGASAMQFLNGDLTVRRGDTVVWAMADPFEEHTVTFTSGATPPAVAEPRPQPAGPPALVVPANVAGPAGGDTYT